MGRITGAQHEFATLTGIVEDVRTDYDKLILEIWTDGRITPDDALLQASAILRHHLDVFVNYDDGQIEFDETPEELNQENTRLKKLLNMSVNDIELSVPIDASGEKKPLWKPNIGVRAAIGW
jgi:DNA-directed RNA polymerase alpha subunit